jgi:hypothetical protein
MAVINQMVDAVPSLVSMGGTITSCAMFLGCSDLARSVSGAENSLATMNPATALDSAKHFALDPFADIANHASAGDWNGAGVAYGHAEVGVAQVALAVSGVCEAVMADSCFLPSLADVVDLGEAASGATSGADAGAGATDVATRADQLASALDDPIAENSRTTAVLRTSEDVDVLGSGGRDLSPLQRATADEGDVLARMPGAHAEPTVLGEASARGLTPLGLAASRDFCPACLDLIADFGGTVTGPRTALWLGPKG